jgi:hypothetical protein
MTDKINEKVINIFAKQEKKAPLHPEEEPLLTSEDGFSYVLIKQDETGAHLDEDKLLERADEQWYIIKVLDYHRDQPVIQNFKVSGERLLEFLGSFISDDRTGRILEIDKYYPQELA